MGIGLKSIALGRRRIDTGLVGGKSVIRPETRSLLSKALCACPERLGLTETIRLSVDKKVWTEN